MPEDVDKIVDQIVGSADEKERFVAEAKKHFAGIRKSFCQSRRIMLRRIEELDVTWDSVILRAVQAKECNSGEPTPTVREFRHMTIVLAWKEGNRTVGIRMDEGALFGDSWRFADCVTSVDDLAVTGFNKPEILYGSGTVPLNPPER